MSFAIVVCIRSTELPVIHTINIYSSGMMSYGRHGAAVVAMVVVRWCQYGMWCYSNGDALPLIPPGFIAFLGMIWFCKVTLLCMSFIYANLIAIPYVYTVKPHLMLFVKQFQESLSHIYTLQQVTDRLESGCFGGCTGSHALVNYS